MAEYTCEFSKIKDGDSTKYAQVPNENTAKRGTLDFADKYNHTPLRNLDKYKISKKDEYDVEYTYAREFKSDQKGVVTGEVSGEEIIFCAFKQEDNDNDVIYIKHDDLTSKAKEDAGAYDVYIRGDDDANGNATFTKDGSTTYTFGWL